MINSAHNPEKRAYKCVHCHDYSIILDNSDLTQPLCPICKGLLQIENEESGVSHHLTNQFFSLT